jgi:hypothetical protein
MVIHPLTQTLETELDIYYYYRIWSKKLLIVQNFAAPLQALRGTPVENHCPRSIRLGLITLLRVTFLTFAYT